MTPNQPMPTHAPHNILVIANHTWPCPALAGRSGVPAQDSLLLIGSPLRDIRHELVGGFAGPIAPDNAVGTYGGTTLLRHQAAGGFAGSRDDQRQGSFADTDRVLIVTHDGEAERVRITGHRGVRRLLRTSTQVRPPLADPTSPPNREVAALMPHRDGAVHCSGAGAALEVSTDGP